MIKKEEKKNRQENSELREQIKEKNDEMENICNLYYEL